MFSYIPIFKKTQYVGKCPGCGLQNPVDADRCTHCGRAFSEGDRAAMLAYANEQKKKGTRVGLYFAIVLTLILLAIGLLQ